MQFTHKVSKGSAYNQIYIPRRMETHFEVGDIVEIKLIRKNDNLYYHNIKESNLSEFKRKLIANIIQELNKFKEIEQIIFTGSFLTSKIDYNDIDIILITDKKESNIEEKAFNHLTDIFNLKFHIISINKSNLSHLLKICPLTRSMFHFSISNKKIILNKEREINKPHLNFLLMMPEDSISLNLSSKTLYNSLRRLIAIANFLSNKDENPQEIDLEIKFLIKEVLFSQIKSNEAIDKSQESKIKSIIKEKLNKIKNQLK
ncbi:MAG: hypothetical protein AABW80_04990 [Nanoarchaeota archaeon]